MRVGFVGGNAAICVAFKGHHVDVAADGEGTLAGERADRFRAGQCEGRTRPHRESRYIIDQLVRVESQDACLHIHVAGEAVDPAARKALQAVAALGEPCARDTGKGAAELCAAGFDVRAQRGVGCRQRNRAAARKGTDLRVGRQPGVWQGDGGGLVGSAHAHADTAAAAHLEITDHNVVTARIKRDRPIDPSVHIVIAGQNLLAVDGEQDAVVALHAEDIRAAVGYGDRTAPYRFEVEGAAAV